MDTTTRLALIRNLLKERKAYNGWISMIPIFDINIAAVSTILVPTDKVAYAFFDSIPRYQEMRRQVEEREAQHGIVDEDTIRINSFISLLRPDLNLTDITYNHVIKRDPQQFDKFIRLYNGREYPTSGDAMTNLKIVDRLKVENTNIIIIDSVIVFEDQRIKLNMVPKVKLFAVISSADHHRDGLGPFLIEAENIETVYESILESLKKIVTDPDTMTPLRNTFYDTIDYIWRNEHGRKITNEDITTMDLRQLIDLMDSSTTDRENGEYFSFFVKEVHLSSVLKF